MAKELRARLAAREKLVKGKIKVNPVPNSPAPRKWWRTPISSLLHRSNTLHDDETDSDRPSKRNQSRRVQPHMIRRTDERPRPINPSGWISQGRMSTAQAGLVEPTRSESSIGEQQPADPTLSQSPELDRPQQPHPDTGSKSELENLSEILRRGRRSLRISDPGSLSHRKFTLRFRGFLLFTCSTVNPPQNHPPSYPPKPRGTSVTRTQTVEFAPSPQLRGRHQAKPPVDESHTQPGASNLEGHVGMPSKSLPAHLHGPGR